MTSAAHSIDRANADFWNELCGTTLARTLGIQDSSPDSLRRFDEAYLGLYPYLLDYVEPDRMAEQTVLEVGLGYGTLGQRIAQSGAFYLGLDLAPGPVAMMNHRLRIHGLRGQAIRGSILDCPVRAGSVDRVVSIGCFHHTGDAGRCIEETHRVLKPGGTATLMVYNRFSYRQWMRWPVQTLRTWLGETGLLQAPSAASEEQKRVYDASADGMAAPETVFLSLRRLRSALRRFSRVEIRKENCGDLSIGFRVPYLSKKLGLPLIPRRNLLSTLGRCLGLDLYVQAWK
jgi:SAM-dependent methyltransferase